MKYKCFVCSKPFKYNKFTCNSSDHFFDTDKSLVEITLFKTDPNHITYHLFSERIYLNQPPSTIIQSSPSVHFIPATTIYKDSMYYTPQKAYLLLKRIMQLQAFL